MHSMPVNLLGGFQFPVVEPAALSNILDINSRDDWAEALARRGGEDSTLINSQDF